jgi:hypothetical protein
MIDGHQPEDMKYHREANRCSGLGATLNSNACHMHCRNWNRADSLDHNVRCRMLSVDVAELDHMTDRHHHIDLFSKLLAA